MNSTEMTPDEEEEYQQYCEEVADEMLQEFLSLDSVATKIKYVRFVSKSKGRNRKPRRNWVEVHLVSYSQTKPYRFYDFDKASLDEWATEILNNNGYNSDNFECPNGNYPGEELRERIIKLWGY